MEGPSIVPLCVVDRRSRRRQASRVTEGPERGTEARSAGVLRKVGSGEGRRSLYPVWGSGGIAPRKF